MPPKRFPCELLADTLCTYWALRESDNVRIQMPDGTKAIFKQTITPTPLRLKRSVHWRNSDYRQKYTFDDNALPTALLPAFIYGKEIRNQKGVTNRDHHHQKKGSEGETNKRHDSQPGLQQA